MRPGLAALPSIVCVLPLPVAPYAKTVALYPSMTPATRTFVVHAYTSAVGTPGAKAWSKAYARVLSRACRIRLFAWWPGSRISIVLPSAMRTTSSSRRARSSRESGRARTTTRMFDAPDFHSSGDANAFAAAIVVEYGCARRLGNGFFFLSL